MTSSWALLSFLLLDILRCQSITDLLNSSIRAIETDMTIQTKTIQDHSLILGEVEAIMEQMATFKDLNNSLLHLETIMVPLSVTVPNHSISINQIHEDLEKIHMSIVNIGNRTTGIELGRQSNFAAIKANQRRISNLELTSNDTDSLYESMEYRLNYLEGIYHQRFNESIRYQQYQAFFTSNS